MALDARTLAFMIGDARALVLPALGYVSSVGIMVLLCAAAQKKLKLQELLGSAKLVAASSYAFSFVLGSACWYVLLGYPTLLWIPISLFLIISLGATT